MNVQSSTRERRSKRPRNKTKATTNQYTANTDSDIETILDSIKLVYVDNKFVEYEKNKHEVSTLQTKYLVKWCGYSHIHNTWHTSTHLKSINGGKNLTSYTSMMKNHENYVNKASTEEQEVYRISIEKKRRKIGTWLKTHKIIHKREAATGETEFEYLVKWHKLPYSECTWEIPRYISNFDQHVKRMEKSVPLRPYYG